MYMLGLGQGRKVGQEEVVQTGMGVGFPGSGPGFSLLGHGSERETRIGKEGRQGGARGEETFSIQEQRSNLNVVKDVIYLELVSESKKKPLEQEGAQDGNTTSETQDDVIGVRNHHSRSEQLLGGGEGDGHAGRGVITNQRRRKIKGLVDLEGSMSHPRRSVRIRNKCPQSAFSSHSRQGMPAVSLSDGDIDNCNLRLRESDSPEEPVKLREISRRVGIRCRKDEHEVLQEYSYLEERDVKTMRCAEEGKKGGLL